MMFDWFNNSKYPEHVPYINGPTRQIGGGYSVGIDNEGDTVLTINIEGGGSVSVTMNEASVQGMIRLLEATIEE